MYNEKELREFIVNAKRSAYAGHGAHAAPSRLKSRDLPFERDRFKYLDSYVGEPHFIGEEVVWYEEDPVWGMNYYGTLLDEVPPEFGEFLKSALKLVTPDAPYRGPSFYEEGDWRFICSWKGELGFFTGEEEIHYKQKTVYRLVFHGGRHQNSETII